MPLNPWRAGLLPAGQPFPACQPRFWGLDFVLDAVWPGVLSPGDVVRGGPDTSTGTDDDKEVVAAGIAG